MHVHDVDSIWTVLAQHADPAGASLVAVSTGLRVGAGEVLVGLDARGNRNFLVPMLPGEAFSPDTSGESLHLCRIDQDGVAYLSAICLSRHLDIVFTKFCRELLLSLQDSVNAATDASKSFQDWKDLFSDGRFGATLTLDEQVGLFGELTVLRDLVPQHPTLSTECWTGPDGSQHDFRSSSLAFEVKASRAREGRRVSISSVDQLDAPNNARLYLVCFRVQVAPGGESIAEVVTEIEKLGVSKSRFHRQLRLSGYRSEDATLYAENRFEVLERTVYDVTADAFPRIVRSSFKGGQLPSGTERLTYTIDLSNSPPVPELAGTYARLIAEMAVDR